MATTKLRITPSSFEAASAALKEKNTDLGMWFAGLASVHPSIVNITIDSTHPKAEPTAAILAAAKIGGRTGQSVARLVEALRGTSDASESTPSGGVQVAAMATKVEKDDDEAGDDGEAPEPKKAGSADEGETLKPFATQAEVDDALQPHVPFATRFKEFLANMDKKAE